ncbi:hypothetical protein QWY77_09300 [Thalassotalea ponticola]|uniref:hypothetical protein n=1 Tax=Thalassotalea ponticola TaxID=1523392 RepID=UPI0025B41D8D|nr:hypothetical protein [Thalassotalea ponticola]MDN3652952.1 hypothetical protein [Thalassotalea ponticola]
MRKITVYLLLLVCFAPVTFFLILGLRLVPYMLASVIGFEVDGIIVLLTFLGGCIGLYSVMFSVNIPLGYNLTKAQIKFARVGLILGAVAVIQCYILLGTPTNLSPVFVLPLVAAIVLFGYTFKGLTNNIGKSD